MTREPLGLPTGSYGTLHSHAGEFQTQTMAIIVRKPSKMLLHSSKEKERFLPLLCRFLGRLRVGMLILFVFALLMLIASFLKVNKDAPRSARSSIDQYFEYIKPHEYSGSRFQPSSQFPGSEYNHMDGSFLPNAVKENRHQSPRLHSHQCEHFTFPPPPPSDRKRIGPRSCPVCYLPVEEAIASMPSFPQTSPVLRNLTYIHEETPTRTELHGGSNFGGYPSLKQRNESFDIKESMTVHCGFVQGNKPGVLTGFDIDEVDLTELDQFHEVIVASAIFGNYDVIQQPKNISEAARKHVTFYMFIDEETEAHMKNSSAWDGSKRAGFWRIIVVHNIPYVDSRRNGKPTEVKIKFMDIHHSPEVYISQAVNLKVPKLLLHRIFPKVRYSIWIDGKLQLVMDPYQILERFLWRQNATFAISRHYSRFDVFEEAEANKAAGKYDNSSINNQVDFYRNEGLTPYSEAKLPITSDVPEGCVIIREHIPITNLFTCLWFNEVDRFTARDQLSFSTVRDKIMSKVDWSANMFMDCERRNFVIQAYHRDLLEHMRPPVARISVLPPKKPSSVMAAGNVGGKIPARKNPARRGRDRRSGSRRRHRKVITGNRDKILN